MDKLNSGMEGTTKRTSKLEDRMIEITQHFEKQKEIDENEKIEPQGPVEQKSNILVFRVPEAEETGAGLEKHSKR